MLLLVYSQDLSRQILPLITLSKCIMYFGKALDEGKEVRAIFCDISKAFDRVWHKGLLFKLKKCGN